MSPTGPYSSISKKGISLNFPFVFFRCVDPGPLRSGGDRAIVAEDRRCLRRQARARRSRLVAK